MDPGVYARAFGVQSEANKVTVTRVACSEISYRREVNTYRRDMNSTVNNIRREQKKLRRCMRGYRRKLDGNNALNRKPYKFGWIANTHPDDDADLRLQERYHRGDRVSQRQATIAPVSPQYFDQQDRGEPIANESSLTHPRALQSQVEAFLKAPNVKPRKKINKNNKDAAGSKKKRGVGKERRRFVIGSGKIQSSERTVQDAFHGEEGDDTYSLLSDSSDEERDLKGLTDENNVDLQMKKRLFEGQYGLTRTGSAYFKAMDRPDREVLGSEDELNNQTVSLQNEQESAIISGNMALPDKARADSNDTPATGGMSLQSLTNSEDALREISLPPVFPFPHKDGMLDPMSTCVNSHPKIIEDIEASKAKKSNVRKGVSYGDIAKLHHGLKTKQLFSLVDQLASRHGISEDIMTSDNSKRHPAARAGIKRIPPKPIGETNLSLTSYASVFYTMKYGYGNNKTDSSKDSLGLSPIPAQRSNEERVASLSITDSGIESEHTQILSAGFSHGDIREGSLDENNTEKNDYVAASLTSKAEISNSSRTGVSGAAQLTGKDYVDRGVALQRRHQRQLRRSSMLEATQYVNSLRNKGGGKKMSFSSEMGSFDKRKESIRSSEDNDMSPDVHKVTWSSAMSRIKLVHTLADLTHII